MRRWTLKQRQAEDNRRKRVLKRYQVWNCAGQRWVPYTQTNDLDDLKWVHDWNLDYVVVDCHQWHINNVWSVVVESEGHKQARKNEAIRVAEFRNHLIHKRRIHE